MQIDLPLKVRLGRKDYALNLNFYRNAHYQLLNKMKVTFSNEISEKLRDVPHFDSLDLTYTLYPGTKRLCDVANVCSVVDKFFCDALTTAGKIEDDNYTVLKNVSYRFGGIDRDNPRVTVELKEFRE
jgi:hypothetical protein